LRLIQTRIVIDYQIAALSNTGVPTDHDSEIAGKRMNETNLKELLARLHRELEQTDSVDPDTLEQVRELDEEVNRLLDSDSSGVEVSNVVDQAKAVETRFAVDHPVAERFLREIVETLSKVGI
jgi:hypothetical protein